MDTVTMRVSRSKNNSVRLVLSVADTYKVTPHSNLCLWHLGGKAYVSEWDSFQYYILKLPGHTLTDPTAL